MKRALLALAIGARVAHADPLAAERVVLGNGLVVILTPDPDVATVAVHTWYATGSDADPAGMPALTTHLALAGSRHLRAGEHEARIEAAGGWSDATLARDHASSIAVVPAGALALALQLEAERMAGLPDAFDAARVGEARTAIAAATRARAIELAIAHALDPSRPGELGDGRAIAPGELAAFWRAHDDPSHATLVIAGRFDPARARTLVERDFGWIPRAAATATPTAPAIAPLDHPVALALHGDVPGPRLAIAFRTDRPYAASTAAIAIAAHLLGGGKHARLTHALADAHLATEVRTELVPSSHGGRFTIEIVLAPGADPEAARAIAFAELARLRAGDVEAAELARATAVLDLRLVESLENLAFRAETLARFDAWQGSLAGSRASLRVDAATLAAVATIWLADSAAVTTVIAP